VGPQVGISSFSLGSPSSRAEPGPEQRPYWIQFNTGMKALPGATFHADPPSAFHLRFFALGLLRSKQVFLPCGRVSTGHRQLGQPSCGYALICLFRWRMMRLPIEGHGQEIFELLAAGNSFEFLFHPIPCPNRF